MSSLSLFQTESPLVGAALTGHKGKKAPGLLVTRPVISHGIAGAHSEAGIAEAPTVLCFSHPGPTTLLRS